MFKVFINGSLYKITNSNRCVESIIDRFLAKWVQGDELIVEKNGRVVTQLFFF